MNVAVHQFRIVTEPEVHRVSCVITGAVSVLDDRVTPPARPAHPPPRPAREDDGVVWLTSFRRAVGPAVTIICHAYDSLGQLIDEQECEVTGPRVMMRGQVSSRPMRAVITDSNTTLLRTESAI